MTEMMTQTPDVVPKTDSERIDEIIAEQAAFRRLLGSIPTMNVMNEVQIHTFEGGATPTRQTAGAIGFDAYARAVVDPLSTPPADNPLRRTMADFQKVGDWQDRIDPTLTEWVIDDETNSEKYAVALPPNKRLMVGLGFASKMEFPMFYWVAPRSGYASRGITVANSPGTVDPDYRGEAGALIENNSNKDFVISHGMRIVQVIFNLALIPELIKVDNHGDLGVTQRGAGGFGSTGTHTAKP